MKNITALDEIKELDATQEEQEMDYPYHFKKDGEVPFWDHPHVRGFKVIPKTYRPITSAARVIDLFERNELKEIDITLLKVLSDAICCTEDQLKRYISSKLSAAQVTKKLTKFRELGLVDRWQVRIIEDEENVKPSSPYTIGIGGYKLLKTYYNKQFCMDPERWDRLGIKAIQRYVATNELRCRMTEAKILRNWRWHAVINHRPHLKSPLGAAEIETPKGRLNFVIERTQMVNDYISFMRERVELWKAIHKKHGTIPIGSFKKLPTVFVCFTSTYSLALEIHEELLMDTYPFPIWFCVEEDGENGELGESFYRPVEGTLQRINVDFMNSKS